MQTQDNSRPIGHVLTWKVPARVSLDSLHAAMGEAGIPEGLAPDLHPRNAMSRALRELCRESPRIARRLSADSNNRPRMQLTREYLSDAGVDYDREAILTLHGTTIVPDVVEAEHVAGEADNLLREHLAQRLTSDLTRLVQRVVEAAGTDLIPLRDQGGAYYVPAGSPVVAQLAVLLERIGGRLSTFAVTLGHGTDESVAQLLAEYLIGQLATFRETIKDLSADSRADVRARRIEKIAGLRQRLDAYRALMAGSAEQVAAALTTAERDMLSALATPAPAPAEAEA